MKEIRLFGTREYIFEFSEDTHTPTATVTTEDGVDIINVTLESECATTPSSFKLMWEIPDIGIHGKWHPRCLFNRGISELYLAESSLFYGAPVGSLYSFGGGNRFTYGLSDSVNRITYFFERDKGRWNCRIEQFGRPAEPVAQYRCAYRFDYRDIRFEDALADVNVWWSEMAEGSEETPDWCRSPVYSHEAISEGDISAAAEACLPYRIKSVTGKSDGVFDMKSLVETLHGMGLKYCLDMGEVAVVNDDVAEEIISQIETAVKVWDVDGVDLGLSATIPVDTLNEILAGGGTVDPFGTAAQRLLRKLRERVRDLKEDFTVKAYGNCISPELWGYGMFHMPDCGGDPVAQRIVSLDRRLLGMTDPHSDTIVWNKDDTVTSVVLQFVAAMFAVPRISLKNDELPDDHKRMLYDWLWFWERNRDVLLGGRLRVESAESLYTTASVEVDHTYIAAKYASNAVIPAPAGRPFNVIVVNGSLDEDVFIRMPKGRGHYNGTVWNCMGEELDRYGASCGETVHVKMPAGARVEFHLA